MLDFKYNLLVAESGRCAQAEFLNLKKRHQCFSGGYGNGKSYAASIKALILLTTFPKYRIAICRYSATDLAKSTRSTFFKVCPPELYDPARGGNRADSMNYLRLINGSEVFWMHLDDADEKTVRGLEINSFIIDQAEEISENMYDHLKARLGRWEVAEVPDKLLFLNPKWPRNPVTNRPLVPAYAMSLCNPDSEIHFLYRRFHPDSVEHQERFHKNYEMVQASSTENPSLDKETLADMMSNDPIWVRRFVFGIWGIPGGSIHEIAENSILELDPTERGWNAERKAVMVDPKFYDMLLREGRTYRIIDHGESSPTCCLWITAWKNYFFVMQEYYKGDALVSEHRANIQEMQYRHDGSCIPIVTTWMDPQCFKKTSQKYGGFWCVADEYSDKNVPGEPIYAQPADNNELSTRNRLNEYFKVRDNCFHPVISGCPSARFFFFRKNALLPRGAHFSIQQTKAQKRKQVTVIEGKPIFNDERDDKVTDHGYDPVRYFAAMHPFWSPNVQIRVPNGSFKQIRDAAKGLRQRMQNERAKLGAY